MSFSITLELYKSRHPKEFEVPKTEYKFFLKNPDTGEYEEQSSLVFPGDEYYLNIEKTNEMCSAGTVKQNIDLSVEYIAKYSTICNLYYDPAPSLTITSNVTTAVAVIKIDNNVVASGTVPLTMRVGKGKNVTITVSEPEYYYTQTSGTYYDYEETFVMTTEDTTKNVTLNERPWITGSIANTSSTTARTYTTTNWHPGYYLVEAWGGKGGIGDDQNSTAGTFGYVYGVIYIDYEETIFSTAGGNGGSENGLAPGGANGGGTGGETSASGLSGNRGGGGGYSALAIGATSITSANINNGKVKIIAGGGGSSFIANGVTYSGLPSSVTNKLTSINPSSTGGAVKIQWIGKTFP